MALTIDALKGLYEKLGGEDFGDVTTIPEAIDKVTEVAEGGGGGGTITVDSALSYTSENPVQNKVITAALKAAKPLIVHGTADPVYNHTAEITDDISLADIYNSAAAGRYVCFECSLDTGNTTRIPLTSYTFDNGDYELVFCVASDADEHTKVIVIVVKFENSTTGAANLTITA